MVILKLFLFFKLGKKFEIFLWVVAIYAIF